MSQEPFPEDSPGAGWESCRRGRTHRFGPKTNDHTFQTRQEWEGGARADNEEKEIREQKRNAQADGSSAGPVTKATDSVKVNGTAFAKADCIQRGHLLGSW
jgi:hypothetical protein